MHASPKMGEFQFGQENGPVWREFVGEKGPKKDNPSFDRKMASYEGSFPKKGGAQFGQENGLLRTAFGRETRPPGGNLSLGTTAPIQRMLAGEKGPQKGGTPF